MYCSYLKIADFLDVQKGDTVLVSSDIQRLIYIAAKNKEKVSPALFIESLQNKIGEGGTLLFPTYNWDFCKGMGFNYKKTPCMTGSLGRAALSLTDFKRTKHPIYSFAVWGRDRDYLYGMENASAFGKDSPFHYLHKKGKALVIDLSFCNSMTFTHYVEEQTGVHYRFLKQFTALYTDKNDITAMKTYSMYVRNLDMNVTTTIDPLGNELIEKDIIKQENLNGIPFYSFYFSDFYDAVEKDIKDNKSRKICIYMGQ